MFSQFSKREIIYSKLLEGCSVKLNVMEGERREEGGRAGGEERGEGRRGGVERRGEERRGEEGWRGEERRGGERGKERIEEKSKDERGGNTIATCSFVHNHC